MAAPRSRRAGPGLLLRAIGRLALLVSLGFAAGLVIGVALEEPKLLLGHLRGESETVRIVDAPFADQAVDQTAGAGATADALEGEGNEIASDARSTDGARLAATQSGAAPTDADARDVQAERLALRDSETAQARAKPAVAAPPARTRSAHVADADAAASRPRRADSQASPSAIASGDASRWAIQVGAFREERVALGLVDQLTAKRYPVDLIPSPDDRHRWRVRIQPIRGKARAQEIANRLKQEDGLPTWLILLEADER